MAEPRFVRRFLEDVAEWEKSASSRDVEALDRAVLRILADPALAGRVPSYYDIARPSHLYRVGSVVIHYRLDDDGDDVEFLDLFFRR